jgi:hypothetical protein
MSDGLAEPRLDADDTFAAWLFRLVGLGDMGVGAAVFAHPPLLGWLIGQTLDPGGEIAARLLGCAAAVLGIGWSRSRHRPASRRVLQAGMLVYNFGAGVVFLSAAMLAAAPMLPSLVAVTHLGLGIAAARVGAKVR